MPGLIDVHAHARTPDMPGIVFSQGVTSLVDAGSQGADKIDEIVAIAKAAPNRVRILLNLSKAGLGSGTELMDIANADVDAARKAIERHRDVIVGVKARLSDTVVGKNDLEAVRRARAAVEPFGLPVMLHVGQTVSPLPAILALLKPGDIVTHIYAPPPNSIFNAARRDLPGGAGRAEARHLVRHRQRPRRAHHLADGRRRDQEELPARHHLVRLDRCRPCLAGGGLPERALEVPDARRAAGPRAGVGTSNAAKLFPAFKGLGTLAVGAPADVTVLEIRQGRFEFVDNADTKRTGSRRLVASATLFARQASARAGGRMSASVRGRCDAIEECYEFMLAYAAQGVVGRRRPGKRRTAPRRS